MNSELPRDHLKLKLKILVGLPPGTPTDQQLDSILTEIRRIRGQRRPTDADWIGATKQHVPDAGTYKYAGEDLSDLNDLLDLVDQK